LRIRTELRAEGYEVPPDPPHKNELVA
jgi:hypothetical protein